MRRMLFVCLGNICRSPLAEGIMLHLKEKHGFNAHIDSAGTAGYHIGETPDNRTIANALKNGVDLSTLRARQFSKADFEAFDDIFVMDQSNHSHVLKLAQTPQHRQKVKLFLEHVHGEKGLEVPDPYYGGENDFEHVFQLVYKACHQLCHKSGLGIGSEN